MSFDHTEWPDVFPRIKNFRTAIDAGANRGGWTEVMAPVFLRVHAFEPIAVNMVTLKQRMEDMSFRNIEYYELALWESNGTATFDINHTNYAQRKGKKDKYPHEFPCRSIDSYGFTDVDFLKIDVDGSEEQVIKGALETIAKYKPMVFIEVKLMSAEDRGRLRDLIGYKHVSSYRIDELWEPR